jgi:DNA-binding SARP family transcriptional activator
LCSLPALTSPDGLTAAKQKAILALLLLHRDEIVSVDRLKEALWEDSPPTTAATALQATCRSCAGRSTRVSRAAPRCS